MKTVEFLKNTYVVEGTVGAPDGAIDLETLPAAKLVELCNLLISNLDLGRRIKVFQSKAKGIKRVTDLLLKYDVEFTDEDPDDGLPDSMQPSEPSSEPSREPEAETAKPEAAKPVQAPAETLTIPAGKTKVTLGAAKAKVRDGSKQAALIDLIKRPEGASIKEICETLGWVNHTARGAISRDLKKKLGLPVTKARAEGRGWVYSLAA